MQGWAPLILFYWPFRSFFVCWGWAPNIIHWPSGYRQQGLAPFSINYWPGFWFWLQGWAPFFLTGPSTQHFNFAWLLDTGAISCTIAIFFSFEQRQLYFHSIVSCSCWPWPLSVVVIQHSAFDFICFHWHLDTLDTSDHRNLLSGILHVGIALQNSCEGTSETDKLDANLVPIPGAQSSQSCWAVF